MAITYAASRADLGPGIRSQHSAKRDFNAGRHGKLAKGHVAGGSDGKGSTMVKQDQPKPVHKPRPSLAYGPDGAKFETQWSAEKSSEDREARRAEYLAAYKNSVRAKGEQSRSASKAFGKSAAIAKSR